MSHINYTLDEVLCSYTSNGTRHHYVNDQLALAILLANDVLFSNGRRYFDAGVTGTERNDYPETVVLFVGCNDVFAWGCADAEELAHKEIGALFRMWHDDHAWGPTKWCAIKRNQKPQPPVIASMKKAGAWDETMERLGENWQDAETQALFARYAERLTPEKH